MRTLRLFLLVAFMGGSFALISGSAWADGILFRAQLGQSGYCHLRFPAIQESTLNSDNPALKDASSGDIIDFYGSCDYDPTGETAVHDQKIQLRQRLREAFSG